MSEWASPSPRAAEPNREAWIGFGGRRVMVDRAVSGLTCSSVLRLSAAGLRR
jgi:hypothetical protein